LFPPLDLVDDEGIEHRRVPGGCPTLSIITHRRSRKWAVDFILHFALRSLRSLAGKLVETGQSRVRARCRCEWSTPSKIIDGSAPEARPGTRISELDVRDRTGPLRANTRL
jgi:hypothetical protein